VKPESGGMEGTEARPAEKPKPKARRPVGPSMEAIVERDNLRRALAHVKRNKGAAGIDGYESRCLGSSPEKSTGPRSGLNCLKAPTSRSR